jgi:glycosyltransferase involved in cell wall biosynthesis
MLRGFEEMVVLVHDGVFSVETGAGMSNARLIHALVRQGYGPRLRVGAVETARCNPDFRPEWYARARECIEGAGGRILPVPNGTHGRDRYGGVQEWRRSSAEAAERVLADGPRPKLVLSFDVPFVDLVRRLAGAEGVVHVHVPRSTGLLHEPENEARLRLEREALEHARSDNTRIGATGEHMRQHLRGDYGVREEDLILLRNGAGPVPFAATDSGTRLPFTPSSEGFVLAYGRAAPYKGFHVLLEALARLGDTRPDCILIATERGGNRAYVDQLRQTWAAYGISGAFLTEFDPVLPQLLQASSHLRAVVVPSLSEPFGLIPAECFLNPECTTPVIASATGGLAEQVIDGETGFTFAPADAQGLADCIHSASTLTREERRALKRRAEARAKTRFDYGRNIESFLREISRRAETRPRPIPAGTASGRAGAR